MLLYRGNDWPDMSEHVVHLTKNGTQPARDAFFNILMSGIVEARSPMGIARHLQVPRSQNAACFSEVPVPGMSRIAQRLSSYGFGVHQDVLIRQEGARVWYVDLDKSISAYLNLVVEEHLQRADPADPFWTVTPFWEKPGMYGVTPYRFEWEREWRVPANMWFLAREVSFVVAPQIEHAVLAPWLASNPLGVDRQPVTAPLVDPRWSSDAIRQRLTSST